LKLVSKAILQLYRRTHKLKFETLNTLQLVLRRPALLVDGVAKKIVDYFGKNARSDILGSPSFSGGCEIISALQVRIRQFFA